MNNRQGRVLIVDNLPQWRDALVAMLRESNYHADAAATITEALEQLDESFYHVLVADIRMEEIDESNIDGMDLLGELDKSGLSEATKVIMLSAFGTVEQMRTSFRDYQVADFLPKDNFNKKAFLECVQRALRKQATINLALEVLAEPGSTPEQVVMTL